MKVKTIKEILTAINNIPLILQYFVPGICCIALYNYSGNYSVSAKYKIVYSIVISYALQALVAVVRIKWFKNIPSTTLVNSALAIIFGAMFVIGINLLYRFEKTKNILIFIFHNTPTKKSWDNIIDYENGSNLKVYIKEKDYYYIGHYRDLDDSGNLVLRAFAKFSTETNKLYANEPEHLNDSDAYILINMEDVEHIEVFND